MSTQAEVIKNPYEAIVDRNPFALKPIPPPPDPSTNVAPVPIAPPAQVELTGIATITGAKCALLEIIPGPGKPMLRPRPLAEGERVESVEVVAINMEKNEVTIKNGPVVTNLTFKIAKSTPGPPPGAAPAGFPPAGPPTPMHQGANAQNPYANGGRGGVMVGGGAVTPPPIANNPAINAAANVSAANVNAAAGDNSGGFRSIPSRNIRTTAPQGELGREQQAQIIENNRAYYQGVPGLPPLPPTMYNPNPAPAQTGGNNPAQNNPNATGFPPIPGFQQNVR